MKKVRVKLHSTNCSTLHAFLFNCSTKNQTNVKKYRFIPHIENLPFLCWIGQTTFFLVMPSSDVVMCVRRDGKKQRNVIHFCTLCVSRMHEIGGVVSKAVHLATMGSTAFNHPFDVSKGEESKKQPIYNMLDSHVGLSVHLSIYSLIYQFIDNFGIPRPRVVTYVRRLWKKHRKIVCHTRWISTWFWVLIIIYSTN